jgi:hypothetical protein
MAKTNGEPDFNRKLTKKERDQQLYRWSSFGSPQGFKSGPPVVYTHNNNDDCAVLVFGSWAEFRELAMTMRGALIGHYGMTKDGRRIRKKRKKR